MEYFFIFRNTKTAEVANIREEGVEKALSNLITERKWPLESIVYQGKKPVHSEMGNR